MKTALLALAVALVALAPATASAHSKHPRKPHRRPVAATRTRGSADGDVVTIVGGNGLPLTQTSLGCGAWQWYGSLGLWIARCGDSYSTDTEWQYTDWTYWQSAGGSAPMTVHATYRCWVDEGTDASGTFVIGSPYNEGGTRTTRCAWL